MSTESDPVSLLHEIKASTAGLLEKMYLEGLLPSHIIEIIALSDELVEIITKDKSFLDQFKAFKDFNPYPFTHPFITAVISVMVSQKLEWNSPRTLKAVSIGALFHDIGMRTLPEEIQCMPEKGMSREQFEIYKTHPANGMEMVARFPEIPAAVHQIILQHHECNGQGFPLGISDIKIYPLAKVVCLAERFARSLLEQDMTPLDGLKYFIGNKTELFQHSPELIKALIKSFIKEIPKEKKQ